MQVHVLHKLSFYNQSSVSDWLLFSHDFFSRVSNTNESYYIDLCCVVAVKELTEHSERYLLLTRSFRGLDSLNVLFSTVYTRLLTFFGLNP